jgi:serine/threonine protein phosphatase PrpC
VFLLNGVASNTINAAEGELQVVFAGAKHQGGRTHQEDRCRHQDFSVKGNRYYLSMVCDGHGGFQVAEKVVQDFGGILEAQLATKEPKQALLDSFAEMDQQILATQTTDKNEPGSTVVLKLIDEANKKEYVANLGDSRLQKIYAKTGALLWSTTDHTVKLAGEIQYIQEHGGVIANSSYGNARGVGLKNNPNGLLNIETPRALGDAPLKNYQGSDGNKGPINNVPTIDEFDLKEDDAIYLFCSDGLPKLIEDWSMMTQDRGGYSYWSDICTLDDDAFYKKYRWACLGTETGCKCRNKSLEIQDEELSGNDDFLKKTVKRLFYITLYVAEDFHAAVDNTTILAVQVKESLNKVVTNDKEPSSFSIQNILFNRYTGIALAIICFLCYYNYSK